jgi:hypothetical protein
MAKLVYSHPGDDVVDNAALVTPSSQVVEYPVENLWDGNPAKPWKSTQTSPNIVWDFGSAQTLDLVAIVHHNLDAGLNVRIQGNATDSWGSPTLDQAITIPAYDPDPVLPWPVNPFKDLTGIGSRSFRFWRLAVVGANSVNVQLGEFKMLVPKRELVHNVLWGVEDGIERPLIEHVTDYLVSTIYQLGARVASLSGEIETSDAGIAAIEAWWDACGGRAVPTLVIPDPAINRCYLMRWKDTTRAVQRVFTNDNRIRLTLAEVSRGLVL